MLDNFCFHFSRADTITRGLDDIVVTALKIDITLVIEMAHITSQAPFAGELVAHRGRVFPEFLHDDRAIAANPDLARFPRFHRLSVDQNCDIVTWVGLA